MALDNLGDRSLGEGNAGHRGDVVQHDAQARVGDTLNELTCGLHHAVVGGAVEVEGRDEHDAEDAEGCGVARQINCVRKSAGVGGDEKTTGMHA